MSQDALGQVVTRALADVTFRHQLRQDPDRALAGYDLSAAERAAILNGEVGELRPLGVDPRVSKIDIRAEQDAQIEWLNQVSP